MGLIQWMRDYPLRLYALLCVLLIPYFGLILLYPTASRSSNVFFLPALILGRINFILVLIAVGFVLSAVFYAQKLDKPARGYTLFGVTVVWLFALISLGNLLTLNDGVIYVASQDYEDRTYHLAYSPAPIECFGPNQCVEYVMVYECNRGGWFCNVIGREIPVAAGAGVYMRVVDDPGAAVQSVQFDGTVIHEQRDWVCRLPYICERDPIFNVLAG